MEKIKNIYKISKTVCFKYSKKILAGKIVRKNPGFALLEILVSIVIGGVIIVSAMSVYDTFTRASLRMKKTQKLEKQTHFALTRISDRIRNRSIGYDFYELYDPGSTNNILFLKDGTKIEFKNENLFMDEEPFFSEEFFVSKAVFSVFPSENPFSLNISDINNYRQPKVLLVLDVNYRKDQSIKNNIKTTISSRIYE